MTVRTLGEEISDLCGSGHAGIWVQTLEPAEAVREIYAAVHGEVLPVMAIWKSTEGCLFHLHGGPGDKMFAREGECVELPPAMSPVPDTSGWWKLTGVPGTDFTRLFVTLADFAWDATKPSEMPGTVGRLERSVVILHNIDMYLGAPAVSQLLADHIAKARSQLQQRVIVLSSEVKIPPLLSRAFKVVHHPMPTKDELGRILHEVIEDESDLPEGGATRVLEAAAGLTRDEAENAFALSLYRHDCVQPLEIFEQKAAELDKNRIGLSLYRGEETFEDIGGLEYLKDFATAILSYRYDNPKLRPRGIVLAGISGTGKSLFAKALGNELQRPTLMWDLSQTLSQWQGVSGQNMGRCLQMAEAMAPCVLFLDECEKALAGATNAGNTDGGTRAGMLGQFLSWSQNQTSDVFLVFAANRMDRIAETNPEFFGRFDETFFLDLPDSEQKRAIWEIQLRATGHLSGDEVVDQEYVRKFLPDDSYWVGRDIERCCRLAAQLQRPLQSIHISTQWSTAQETIQDMQEWATGRFVSAEYDGLYNKAKHLGVLQAMAKNNGKGKRDTIRRKAKPEEN